MESKLVMKFLTSTEGKYFSLTIDNIKSDMDGTPLVTDQEVNDLMDVIVDKNIFISNYGNLIGKKEARVVTTESNELSLA